MSRILISRTNKEFDKCAELLRNILSVQESRQHSKTSNIRQMKQKNHPQTSINTRTKKMNNQPSLPKSSFVKTNLNGSAEAGEHRSSYSPNKSLHATIEESSLSKNRASSSKSRKHVAHSPSPPAQRAHQRLLSTSKSRTSINNHCREKSPSLLSRRRISKEEELVRSSSCGDLPSSKMNSIDQLTTHLTRIRTISKQIRTRISNFSNDSQCSHLWHELERSLSYVNHHVQLQFSLTPLRNEIFELRKELQTTNNHFQEYDLIHHHNEQYVHLQKKFNPNQEFLLHNEELKKKCYFLQDKLKHLEQHNTRLIQRMTQQDLRSIAKCTESVTKDKRLLLQEEIQFLKEKLYHVYDDVSTLFHRNQALECAMQEQKQQLTFYKQYLTDLKQSAQFLLRDLDHRSIEEKMKRFLNHILIDQYHNEMTKSSSSYQTPTAVFFDTSHQPKTIPSSQLRTATNKLRPKSLLVTPHVLNDSEALSRFHKNKNLVNDVTHCSSSSTIDDADSTLTSPSSTSLYYQQRLRPNLYNSLPSLTIPTTFHMTKTIRGNQQIYNNESSAELDQISDLTSKMFSSDEEENLLANGDMNTSTTTSSSTLSSDAKKLMYM